MPSPKGVIEDSYNRLAVPDFSSGLVTYLGQMAMPVNASPDQLNVIQFPGRLKYRGGMARFSDLADTADNAKAFYDRNGDKHFAVFEGGDLVDVATGAEAVVDAGWYTPGQRVGVTVYNGVLYYSAIGKGYRFWDPATATFGAVTQTGPNVFDGSPYLFLYTNAIVALGVQYDAADFQPTVMGWSNVDDPTFWDASNSQAVGPLTFATLEFGIIFGIANTGVPPTRTLIIGRSDSGIISYTGALGALEENTINCPVGCKDGASAVFVPGAEGFGIVVFLGTDAQFWATNGINANPISLQILDLVAVQANYTNVNLPGTRYWAGYNEKFAYYFCNLGDFQFVYKWDLKSWSLFTGWPNGPIIYGDAATDGDGIPALFVASANSIKKGFFRLGLAGRDDDGMPPRVYWSSAWLHGGDIELTKLWHWIALSAYNTGTVYSIVCRGLARADDGSYQVTDPIYMQTAPNGQAQFFVLDQSLLDGPDVLAGIGLVPAPTAPVVGHARLAVPYVAGPNDFLQGLQDYMEDLKAVAIQVTVAYHSGIIDFDILAVQLRYLEDGYLREGGNLYDGEIGTPPVFEAQPDGSVITNNRFVPVLSPGPEYINPAS